MDPETSDDQLLAAFLGGDQGAFDTLMRRHEDRIFGLALRMTGNRADALDATQDAFVAAFRKARTFKGTSAFSTWLYRIGINACHDLLRKKSKLVPTEEIDPGAMPDNMAEDVGLRMDLALALQDLNPDYRQAVLMHDLGGFPYEDIAVLTGVHVGTVKSRISRGRKKLAEMLEQRGAPAASNQTT